VFVFLIYKTTELASPNTYVLSCVFIIQFFKTTAIDFYKNKKKEILL